MKGSVGHASLSFRVRVLAGGVLSATVVRDGVSHLARGTYSMSGNEASFQLRESGGGATYSGKLGAGGASGRATLPDGTKERFKVKR